MTTAPPHSTSPFRLDGRVALVTGAGRGLGLAMARSLGQAGATVHLNGRSKERLEEASAALGREGLKVRATAFDVACEAEAARAVDEIVAAEGRLDILVNNVGQRLRRPLEEMSGADFQDLLNVDLASAFVLSKLAAPHMKAGGVGRIINVTSISAYIAQPGDAAYIAAKGGLASLTRGLACEFGAWGITCNSISPGPFRTETNAALARDEKLMKWIEGRIPLKRWGEPHEIGGVCVFLASDAASFVSGSVVMVDGGMTASI